MIPSARSAVIAAAAIGATLVAQAQETQLHLALPTDNDALFRGGGPEFYQHIERDLNGVKSQPWEGGRYGFVRNPVETPAGLVYSRFHEGIDIRPLRRDPGGEPLDEVRAIADGTVVYTNSVPAWSNYGNYVVVEHRWDGSPYYSLYGHLASISARAGERVTRGAQLGVMGYTGAGLSQERAHVHLELNLMLSHAFESWHAASFKNEPNHHGIYNGINLVGLDIARLYLAVRKNPELTIPQFLADEEVFYRVALPHSRHFELLKRYRWLAGDSAKLTSTSWEIAFNRAGIPLKISATAQSVQEPTLTYVKKSRANYSLLTREVVGGSGDAAFLTQSGKGLMRLFIWPD